MVLKGRDGVERWHLIKRLAEVRFRMRHSARESCTNQKNEY